MSGGHESNNSEIFDEFFRPSSKQGLLVVRNGAHLHICRQASLYETLPILHVDDSGALQARVPVDAPPIRRVLM
jgi:hypothetical protein